jgi:hypothetical protein
MLTRLPTAVYAPRRRGWRADRRARRIFACRNAFFWRARTGCTLLLNTRGFVTDSRDFLTRRLNCGESNMLRRSYGLLAMILVVVISGRLEAATRTWVGGNDPWDTDIFNWSGNDEPDPDDDVVFNTNNHVEMAMDNEILSLTMSNSMELDTQTYYLDVNGAITLSDAGTLLRVGESNLAGLPATSVSAYSVTINSGATYANANFTSFLDPSGIGLLDINTGGTLSGHGTIRNGDGIASPTVVFSNDGVIRPGSVTDGFILIGLEPTARTLTLSAIDGEARLDLDGAGGGGLVDVTRNQTLDIDVELNDAFDGTIDLAHNATLDIEDAWTFSGTMNVDNGFVPGQNFPLFIAAIPADIAYLQGGRITMSGSATTINVLDGDGTLQFDTPFTADAGTIANNGLVVFNQDATINSGVDFQMLGVSAGMRVGPGANVTINDDDMDFDGSGASTNEITVEAGGRLTMNLDSFEGNDRADGFLTLNSGSLQLSVSDGSWTMDRRLTLNNSGGGTPTLSGSGVVIGDDTGFNGLPDADVRVTGNGVSQITSNVTWNSDAEVDVDAGATLSVVGFSTFNSVNGAESAQFNGPGSLLLSGGQVNEATTLDFSGGTVGLDSGGSGIFLLAAPDFTVNAPLTIHAAEIDDYGRSVLFPTAQSSELTINAGVGGQLNVNLDNPLDSWTVNNVGIMHVDSSGLFFNTFLTGHRLEMNGTMNVDGLSRTDAPLSIGGTANLVDAASNLRLGGGDLANTNRLEGGTISGPGELSAGDQKALHGHGTIAAAVDFDGNRSELLADDGTLTLTGSILDVGTIGTADSDGILNVTNTWDTAVASQVRLRGGEITGATINNLGTGGIAGQGLVSARVRNDTVVAADSGSTLVLDNPANNNDWDGAGGGGRLVGTSNGTLELHDNAAFLFTGTVEADKGTVLASGFELEFDPGSTLALANGGLYRSTHATDIGGTVNVGSGAASRIAVPGTVVFESTSATTLGGDLVLDNAVTRIKAGATFAGGSALRNPSTAKLVIEDGASVNVLVHNEGTVVLGNSPGQTTGTDYEQLASGVLEIEVGGLGLADYDRMTLSGVAQLGGELDVALLGGFSPVLNDMFTILSATGGILGSFAAEDFSAASLGPGLAWDVLYNPTNVQLQVVADADLDGDGDVDGSDFLALQRTNPSLIPQWEAQFGSVPASAAAVASVTSVPEPTAIVLLTVALVTLAQASRRQPRTGRLDCC